MKRKATRKKRFSLNTPVEEARIQSRIKADPNAAELTSEELPHVRPFREFLAERRRRRSGASRRKVPVVVRLEPHIVSFFKSDNADWQARMNAALAEYVRRHRPRR